MSTLKEDLLDLREAKNRRAALSREKADAENEFKRKQAQVLERMEQEDIDSLRSDGTLFSRVNKIKGQIEDRAAFIEWALENDEDLVERKERQVLLNQLVRTRLDNGEPMPPGVTFRHDDYVSHTSS